MNIKSLTAFHSPYIRVRFSAFLDPMAPVKPRPYACCLQCWNQTTVMLSWEIIPYSMMPMLFAVLLGSALKTWPFTKTFPLLIIWSFLAEWRGWMVRRHEPRLELIWNLWGWWREPRGR